MRGKCANLLVMRLGVGNGGWVEVEEIDLPGPLLIRFRLRDGRLRPVELYVDTSEADDHLDPGDLRRLPLGHIEAVVNSPQVARDVLARADVLAPDVATLASHYATTFSNPADQVKAGNWVVASMYAQLVDRPGSSDNFEGTDVRVMRVKPVSRAKRAAAFRSNATYRLSEGPGSDGLTDDFLGQVARAYAAAMARGERPNVAMAEQTGYPVRTVQRWVYTARQRGIMQRGEKGRAG